MSWLSLHTAPLLPGSSQTAYELVGSLYRRVPFGELRFDPQHTGRLSNTSPIVVPCGFIREQIVCAAIGPLESGPGIVHQRITLGPFLPGHDVEVRIDVGRLAINIRDETFEGPDRMRSALEEIAFSNADVPDDIRAIAKRGLGLETNQ